jgi:hypothetical protein
MNTGGTGSHWVRCLLISDWKAMEEKGFWLVRTGSLAENNGAQLDMRGYSVRHLRTSLDSFRFKLMERFAAIAGPLQI